MKSVNVEYAMSSLTFKRLTVWAISFVLVCCHLLPGRRSVSHCETGSRRYYAGKIWLRLFYRDLYSHCADFRDLAGCLYGHQHPAGLA